MVIGFDRFREAFQDFAENYIVIGGSACDWLFTSLNTQFRATKDIDLVVIAERMSPAFAAMIWEFVRAGGYSAYERKDGKKCFYRFLNPTVADYPFMLEFFAREPIGFPIDKKTVIVPIPVDDDDVSSLSGILMDENYYSFIRSHRIEVEGVSILPGGSPSFVESTGLVRSFDAKSQRRICEGQGCAQAPDRHSSPSGADCRGNGC